LLAHVTFEW